MKIEIDSDITKARTIPSKFYHSKKVYRKLKKLFDRSWQFIGDNDLLEKNNSHPGILLEGMVNEPYVLTNDNGKIRCLSNVCTHRGNIVCNDACNTKTLVCGYHGRQFEIDGKMKFMPEFDDVENFPSNDDNLPEIEILTQIQAFRSRFLHQKVVKPSLQNRPQVVCYPWSWP